MPKVIIRQTTPPDVDIEINGVNEGSVVSGGAAAINLEDSNGDPVIPESVTVVGDTFTVELPAASTGWVRNPDWLPLPDISATNNKMVCLYLVYESGGNDVRFNCTTNAFQVDWGDGSALETIGVSTHVYDYAAITSPIKVDEYGRNYKQVIIEVTELIVNSIFEFRPANNIITKGYSCGDIRTTMTSLVRLSFSYAPNLEIFEQFGVTQSLNFNSFYQNKLPYLKQFHLNPISSIQNQSSFSQIGEVSNFVYEDNGSTTCNSLLLRARIRRAELKGSLITSASGVINECQLLEEAVIDFPLVQNISNIANNCMRLRKLTFTNCSNITISTGAFDNCSSLEELILTGMTVGFSVRNSRMSSAALLALANSVGPANGSQTVITTGNPDASDPAYIAVFNSKGYTVTT